MMTLDAIAGSIRNARSATGTSVPTTAATHHDEAATWLRRFRGDTPMWRRDA